MNSNKQLVRGAINDIDSIIESLADIKDENVVNAINLLEDAQTWLYKAKI